MSEIEQSIPVGLGLRDVETRSNEGYQDGVKNVIQELAKELRAFLLVRQRKVMAPAVGGGELKPRNGRNL